MISMTHRFGKYSHVIVPIIIAITTLVIYSNTFSVPFLFDDTPNITENHKIRFLSRFLSFSGTRYIGELSFALNYYFGKLDVFGYHLVNIIIHITNGILVWWLVNLIFKTPVMRRAVISPRSGIFIALTASLIFISHPIQTQAVTYTVQRLASLATLFYLLSVVLFVKWRLSSGSRYRFIYYFISLLSAILSMKTKEMSFTLPFVILIYEFIFFRDKMRRAWFLIPYLLTLLIIPLTVVNIVNIGTDNKPIGDIIGEVGERVRDTERISRGSYMFTQFRVIVTYIRLLFFPVNQNLDYDYPVYHSFFTPVVFLSFLFLLSIFGFAVYLFMRSRRGVNGYGLLASFGIFWFFITLSVESSIIPIRDVIFEHRLYLPFAGAAVSFCSTVIYGIDYWRRLSGRRISLQVAALILLVVTVLPLSAAAYQRNRVWKDEITLWRDVAGKSPFKARTHINLAFVSYNQGLTEEAVKEYRTALRLQPGIASVPTNLALVYYNQGRIDEAIEEYKVAIRLKPEIALAHLNLGLAYSNKGYADEAIEEFTTALSLNPRLTAAHFNLGLAYLRQGRPDKAEEEFKTTIRLKPDSPEVYNNIGIIYARQGQIDDAILAFRTALRLKPDFTEAENNLMRIYRHKKIVK